MVLVIASGTSNQLTVPSSVTKIGIDRGGKAPYPASRWLDTRCQLLMHDILGAVLHKNSVYMSYYAFVH